MTSVPPPLRPPPSEPAPAAPAAPAAPPPGADAAEIAAAVAARAGETFDAALERLGAGSAHVGLSVDGVGASVWPPVAVMLMTVALVADRFADFSQVRGGWMAVLLIVGAVTVVGELRHGGRLATLAAVPERVFPRWLRMALLLLLAAQCVNWLSWGLSQVLWWAATVVAAVPVVLGHARVTPLRIGGRELSPALIGSALVVVALFVGLLPDQADAGVGWAVVSGVSAVVAAVCTLRAVPYGGYVSAVCAALVVGVAITMAALSIVGLLWIAAAWLLAASEWGTWAAGRRRPPLRSVAALGAVGGLVALLGFFCGFDTSTSRTTTCIGGLSTDPYSVDYNLRYSSCAYLGASFWFYSETGRAQPAAPLAAAGLAAMTVLAWRGRLRRYAAYGGVAGAAGVAIWIGVSGSFTHFGTWVSFVGVLALLASLAWGSRRAQPVAIPAHRADAPPPPPPPPPTSE